MITIKEILKQRGHFSKDIDNKIKQGQIKINGESVNEDISLDVIEIHNGEEFVFDLCKRVNPDIIKIIGIENIFDCNLNKGIFKELKSFCLLQVSKREFIVLKLNK